MTLTLVWLDGTKEVVSCDDITIRENVLIITARYHETRYIPMANLREWTRDR